MKKEYFFVIISVIIIFSIALIAGCAGGSGGGSDSGGNNPIPSPTATTTPTSTPTGTVAGTVKDGERPLYGAKCFLTLEHGVLETYTNSLGEFTLEGVPEGKWFLKIEFAGYDTWQQEIEVVAGETTGVSVGMDNHPPTPTEVGNLRGKVIDSNGNVVKDATVRVTTVDSRPAFYASTDSSGNYIVYNVPIGTWAMVVYKGDFSSTTTVTVVEGETVTVPDQVITPTPSPTPTTSPSPDPTGSPTATPTTSPSPSPSPTISPEPQGKAEGYVSNKDTGEKLPGVRIDFKQGSRTQGSRVLKVRTLKTVYTDSLGNFSVEGLPEEIMYVELRLNNYWTTSYDISIKPGINNEFHWKMELR